MAAAGLLISVFAATADGSRVGLRTTGAFWSASTSTSSVTSTVYVSAVNCRRVGAGQYEGQRSGAELFGSYLRRGNLVHPFDFVGYYSYCHGHTASYQPEFLVSEPGVGLLKFRPAGFQIAPGDPLKVSIVVRGAHLQLSIADLNTHRSAGTIGPSLGLRTGWVAGVLPLFGGPTGRPVLRGSLPLVEEYSPTGGPNTDPGPAPFAPVVFRSFRVNGVRLGYRRGAIISSTWHGSTGGGASVTDPRSGAFIAVGHLRPPRLGKTVDVTPVSGTSLVQSPGEHRFHRLTQGQQIPNGSKIDASNGSVQLTLGLPHGRTETGVFYSGQFQLQQDGRTGATTATLTGGSNVSVCPASTPGAANTVALAASAGAAAGAPAGTASAASAAGASASRATVAKAKGKAKPKKSKKLRSLWANAHGNFTTKGSGGAASVLGTKWFTEDTCAGTYFKVVRDKIKVTVYYPHVHTVVVTQGHSFFAPNEAPIIYVAPVSSSAGRYNVQVSGYYDLTVISNFQPYYVDAAVSPQLPSGGNNALYPDGTVNGTARWHIIFHITPDLGHYQDWNVGVRVNGRLYIVKLRVG